ncbi:hypothetical protein Trisim1_007300 [Trichoderma cf. simile WF8]
MGDILSSRLEDYGDIKVKRLFEEKRSNDDGNSSESSQTGISIYSYYTWGASWSRVKAHHQHSSAHPGYKFSPASSAIFLAVLNSSNAINAVNFADRHFYEDLDLWFNLGMHYAPHTGDLPNTVFTTAHSALIIEPLKYLDLDTSRATLQLVRLNYKNEKVQSVKTFDSQNVTCRVDTSSHFHHRIFVVAPLHIPFNNTGSYSDTLVPTPNRKQWLGYLIHQH